MIYRELNHKYPSNARKQAYFYSSGDFTRKTGRWAAINVSVTVNEYNMREADSKRRRVVLQCNAILHYLRFVPEDL